MKDLENFANKLKSKYFLNFLKFHLSEDFASETPNYRQNIRQHILKTYNTDASNLEQLPKSDHLYFSIAHCKSVGGYAVCNQKIGFDLEDISRLDPQIVKRVSTKNENQITSDIRWIWPAKESLVKLASEVKDSSIIITDFNITDWKANAFQASYKNDLKLHGSIYSLNNLIMSICFYRLDQK